jgi:3-hydroxymyristoyl/3-hydroxydecanoyl-(acyl carrier protein) dehydratase
VSSAPFDGLTVVQERVDEEGWHARVRVESTSRAFDGHFAAEPILPGIAHLVLVGHALRAMGGSGTMLRELPSVRFREAVRPGDVLEVVVDRPDAEGRSRFAVRRGATLAVTGTARGGRDG